MMKILTKTNKETRINDEIKVLNIIEQQAKKSISEIAKKCGFSNQKVARIIKDLEKNKIIWGYSAITDGEAKKLKHYMLLVKRSMVPLDAAMQNEVIFEKLDEYIPNLKIDDIFITHEKFNTVITFYAPDLITAKGFVQEMFRRVEKYVKDYVLLEILFPIRKNGQKNPQIKKLVEYI